MSHTPVMIKESLEYLALEKGDSAIDATAGFGGHTFMMAEAVGKEGRVLAIERDGTLAESLTKESEKRNLSDNVTVFSGSYGNMANICEETEFKDINGVIFDLGFSSWHIEKSGRGFSFLKNERLDMRYDVSNEESVSATDIINGASKETLGVILREYGGRKEGG